MSISISRRKINKYKSEITEYLNHNLIMAPSAGPTADEADSGSKSEIRYSLREEPIVKLKVNEKVLYSCRDYVEPEAKARIEIPNSISSQDRYDSRKIKKVLDSSEFNIDKFYLLSLLHDSLSRSFSECVIVYIRERNLSTTDVYKSAQIDRRLFSKIISSMDYKPSKDTAVAISFALRLSLVEANDLLTRAGYALSHSCTRDLIIEYFFQKRVFDLSYINTALFEFNEKPLGS